MDFKYITICINIRLYLLSLMKKVWIKLHSRLWLKKNLFYKNEGFYKNREHYIECQTEDSSNSVSPPLKLEELDIISKRIFNVSEETCAELSWCSYVVNIDDYPEYLV